MTTKTKMTEVLMKMMALNSHKARVKIVMMKKPARMNSKKTMTVMSRWMKLTKPR